MKKQNKTRGKTVTRALCDDAKEYFISRYPNKVTNIAYSDNYRKYIVFCRQRFDCKTKDECAGHIADYSEYLQSTGLSASTIHTYLAPVCVYHGVNMKTIAKPKRYVSQFKRGRSFVDKTKRRDNDMSNPVYERTVMFQSAVGIRRKELERLTGADFVLDETNYPCVRVKRGKGGKKQLQRVLPDNTELVKSFFENKGENERIFEREELTNKLNYHALRAKNAQAAYEYYNNRLRGEGGELYRKQLEREIYTRWNKYCLNKKTGNPRYLNPKELKGTYALRGENRTFAINNGLPTEYDRLALMAVSIFHLSHWRLGVTVESYLLAI